MRTETLTGMFLLAAVAASPMRAESLLRPYEIHPVAGAAEAVAIGDVDGDGRNDVVMTTGERGDKREANRLFVFSQGDDGRLRSATSYPASSGGSVAVGDVNGDRRKDVVVDGAGVFLQNAAAELATMKALPARVGSLRVRVADFNGDRRDDVVSICGGAHADDVDLFLQQANGRLGPDQSFRVRHHGDDDMEVGDLTGDGRADLVVVSSQGSPRENIGVLPQDAAGGFGEALYYDLGVDALYGGVAIGDVNGDGLADLVVSSPGGGAGGAGGPASAYVAALHGKPGGGFAPAVFYASAASPMAVEIDDLDLDGRDDVVVLHGGGPAGVYLQGADGRLTAERTFALPRGGNANPHGLAIGDVDSDGLPDVVAASDEHGLVVLHHSGQVAARPCVKDGTALCLMNGRFEVRVAWKDQHNGGREGVGQAVARTDLSGTFWFFSPESAELTVKAIDGRDLNDSFWIFYGALSDVEYRVSALDTQTGVLRGYPNPAGRICGRADTAAFPMPGSESAAALPASAGSAASGTAIAAGRGLESTGAAAAAGSPPPPPPPDLPPPTPTPTGGTCTPGPETLCLLDGRIKVEARWKTRDGAEGRGAALPDTNASGFFWFFSPENFELTVKALDGHAVNDRFWFFYGALSDVEYWIDVTDVRTGKFRTYHNPPGGFCGKGDVAAL